ncbi:MgtC/SapB family protein [Devosia beringensis]|uniref:MgtC/SapB family protein n=1 Tax=Devosia beringensis TaxID=2657486 RepID=UPI00186B781A|nr:MgtC/SapB family protein [Devosia beringensis]
MEQTALFSRLGVALAIGLLVGLERGWSKRTEEDHQRAAGFRTFALSGLLGGVAGLVSLDAGGIFLGMSFLAYAAAFTAFHWLEATADQDLSVTSVIAGLLTFLLGALAILGDINLAIASAVAMTVLLALREQLHRWVAALTWKEISSVLTLLAMTFLLLPVLPDRTIDPWNALNPHEVWLLTILIATVSFAGYVAVRLFGDRLGIVLAALAGGLASSTATTLALARMARAEHSPTRLLSAGILLAGTVMLARVAAVTLLLNPPLFGLVAPPLAAAGTVLLLAAGLLTTRSTQDGQASLSIDNPLAIATALRMGGLIAVVMLGTAYLLQAVGSAGVVAIAALSGLVDADALTISMARLGGGALALPTAGWAVLVGVAVNTVSKAVLTLAAGGARIALPVALASLAALAAGLLAAVVPYW